MLGILEPPELIQCYSIPAVCINGISCLVGHYMLLTSFYDDQKTLLRIRSSHFT